MSEAEARGIRQKLGLVVTGHDIPKPVVSFAYFGFDKVTLATLQREGFSTPQPIQSHAIPAALSGRDVIGIAKSGFFGSEVVKGVEIVRFS